MLKLLLSRGVKINTKGYWDRSALHYAALNGHTACCQYLISKGADKDAKDTVSDAGYKCYCNSKDGG
jgi:ankyrin repeat protein